MRTRPLTLTLVLVVLAAGACGSSDTTVGTGGESSSTAEVTSTADPDTPEGALEAARARWAEAGITDYDMTYSLVCFCMQQATTVQVRDGEIVDVAVSGEGDYAGDPMTVEAMFADIDEAITTGAASVEADYDDETGRPDSYYIDVSEEMADEEHGVSVSAFEAVAPSGGGSTSTSAVPSDEPVVLDEVTEPWGCGTGFHAGNSAQTVGVFLDWSGQDGPIPTAVELPSTGWTAEVQLGEDLFANWCSDMIVEGQAQAEVDETWEIVEGTLTVDVGPSGGTVCGTEARVQATGLVAERSDGSRAELGDIEIANDSYGCFAG